MFMALLPAPIGLRAEWTQALAVFGWQEKSDWGGREEHSVGAQAHRLPEGFECGSGTGGATAGTSERDGQSR